MKYPFATVLFLIIAISFTCSNGFAQTASREDLLREIKAKRAELQQLETQFLEPSQKDREAYAGFLSQPKTGLVRLLPRQTYDSEFHKKNPKTMTMRGGGAYYSFTRLTHEYGYGSDIELNFDHLSVGFVGASYGILINLGNVALDKLTLEDPRVRKMSDYTPPSKEQDAFQEGLKFKSPPVNENGRNTLPVDTGVPNGPPTYKSYESLIPIDLGGYRSRLPAMVNCTYLLRSIDYSKSDVLVAFKVVRKDSDGSVVLAWKLLKKYPVPQLARGK